jgi:hypothetical protein
MQLGKTYICDDIIFNASCINHVVGIETCWPIVQKKNVLIIMLPKFLRGVGLIDKTLININKP